MNLMILDTNLQAVSIVDVYESLIWVDRFQQCGDFELYVTAESDLIQQFKEGYYLQNRDSEHVMLIERVSIASDVEKGNHITITGRSLESILNRRIIWGQKTLHGNFQNELHALLEECIISPTDSNRRIPNVIFEESDDPLITELTIDAQYTGDNLYDVITKLCEERNIGFKLVINDDQKFVFKFYAGVDRSFNQSKMPYVVFSPSFDNILNSNYMESKESLKNVTLVAGEGEGTARKYAVVGTGVGLERRELFTDARDITSDIGNDVTLTADEYTLLLKQRGSEKLAEHTDIVSFEGQAETSTMFRYNEDFFTGDIVQIANEYGHEATACITEIVISENEEGISVYPTFKTALKEGV